MMKDSDIKEAFIVGEKAFSFRLCPPYGYDRKILEALRTIFPHITFTEEWFKWFSVSNPYARCYWFIAELDNNAVATYGFLPIRVSVLKKQYGAALAVNTGLFADYWGTGIYQKFGKFCLDTVTGRLEKRLIVALSNNIAYAAHLRLGWFEVGKVVFMELQKEAISKTTHSHSSGNRAQKEDISYPPSSLDEFLREASTRCDLFIDKDASILKWRYSRPDYNDSY